MILSPRRVLLADTNPPRPPRLQDFLIMAVGLICLVQVAPEAVANMLGIFAAKLLFDWYVVQRE